jgi:phosphate transport system ATP-binding protein
MSGLPDPRRYAIQTRSLHLWYGDLLALNHVDVEICRGSITALIGPSGCGKTTLLRCMNRLNERFGNVRTSGEIFVLGKNIYDTDVSLGALRRHVGMVFQRPNPLPLSIYENVLFGLRVHHETRNGGGMSRDDIVEQALRSVALWDDTKDRLRSSALSLTLEQQQKLCIARLLPMKPQIILMDEPCSALDAEGTAAIERMMGRLRGHYTIVIVTHSMGQARRTSDDCIFMLLGSIVEHGPTTDLFTHPRQEQTRLYVEGRYG